MKRIYPLIAWCVLLTLLLPALPLGAQPNRVQPPGGVVLQAAGRGNPWINLQDGVLLEAAYEGPAATRQALTNGQAQPRTLAAGDLDQDGVPDLLCG